MDREQLLLIRSQTLALMAQITAEPKPSYAIDGQQVSWESYLARLAALVEWCDARLAAHEPFEELSRGTT
jgi:hypothetical protein